MLWLAQLITSMYTIGRCKAKRIESKCIRRIINVYTFMQMNRARKYTENSAFREMYTVDTAIV